MNKSDQFFIIEEVDDVESLDDVDDDHGVGAVAEFLVLICGEGDVDQGPCDDAWSPVVEKLEVKDVAESWVEFDAHVQIIDKRATKFSVT